jgi:HEPN domain-containing protein
MQTRKIVDKLKEKSERLYENAKSLEQKKDYTFALFMLEQSLQLFLKAKLMELYGNFPKIHDIRELLEILSKKNPTLKKYVNKIEIDILNEVYIGARYSVNEYSHESFKACEKFVKEIRKILEK